MSQAVLFVAYVTLQYFLSNFWVFMYPSLCVPLPIPFLSFACCVQYEELLHMEIERTAVKENTLAVTGRPLEPRDTQRSSRKWHKLSEHAHTHTHAVWLNRWSTLWTEVRAVLWDSNSLALWIISDWVCFCSVVQMSWCALCRFHSNHIAIPCLTFSNVHCRLWDTE